MSAGPQDATDLGHGSGPLGLFRRPWLLPGLTRIRRPDGGLQLGLDPPVAAVLTGLDGRAHDIVQALDGSRDIDGIRALASDLAMSDQELADLLGVLADGDLLADGTLEPAGTGLSAGERARLAPDRAAIGLQTGAAGLVAALDRRQGAWIEVRGAGRVGSAVAVLVASAGVGCVTVRDPLPAAPADQTPAGLGYECRPTAPSRQPGVRSESREAATRRRIQEAAPSTLSRRPVGATEPDLTVLAPADGPDAALAAAWSRRRSAHLLAYVEENRGVVGPLVEPGRTSCLFCLELHRRDRDAHRAGGAVRLRPVGGSPACDVVLATLVAAQTAMHAVAYVDQTGTGSDPFRRSADDRELPVSHPTTLRDATLETDRGDGVTRRRSWSVHPACSCRWPSLVDAEDQPPEPER